jgi:lactate permease
VYQQDFNPVSDSLGLTAIFAALPLICLFVLLGGFKMKSQWAALIALGVSMLVALIVYSMLPCWPRRTARAACSAR